MYSSYSYQIIARQRMDEAARKARAASERREFKTRTGRHFPKVRFPSRFRFVTARPA